jgi:putative acetyltransferase
MVKKCEERKANLMTIEIPSTKDHEELQNVWEASVRVSHDFLAEEDIQAYKRLIGTDYLKSLSLYCIKQQGSIAGFLGVDDKLIQMLFVHPAYMRQGVGKALLNFAISVCKTTEVDVNEQNTQALAFYKGFGFEPFERFESDAAGKPFPILNLVLRNT